MKIDETKLQTLKTVASFCQCDLTWGEFGIELRYPSVSLDIRLDEHGCFPLGEVEASVATALMWLKTLGNGEEDEEDKPKPQDPEEFDLQWYLAEKSEVADAFAAAESAQGIEDSEKAAIMLALAKCSHLLDHLRKEGRNW